MITKQLRKQTWYPRPHIEYTDFQLGSEIAGTTAYTIVPIAMYDEGLGSPSSYNANRQHASFAEAAEPNCYPNSTINHMMVEVEFTLTKGALHTDNIDALKVCYNPIFMAFKEDYTAIDEVTSIEVQDVLEMQTEATDRQGYPLWNGGDMTQKYTNSSLQATNVPGLTASQALEGVTFDEDTYYDALHFLSIEGKLKSVQGGLKWLTLTRRSPTRKIRIHIRPKVKAMNPYTFFGVMLGCPQGDTRWQIPPAADTTAIGHVHVSVKKRFNEWNQSFNMDAT